MSNENDKPVASEPPAASVVLHGNRTREITLEYPAEFNGVLHETVTIRRMTAAEVGEFVERAQGSKPGDGSDVPEKMLGIPKELFFALDPDDRETIEEAIYDFLPRRLQMALAFVPETGADTSPPSQASSEAESSSTKE